MKKHVSTTAFFRLVAEWEGEDHAARVTLRVEQDEGSDSLLVYQGQEQEPRFAIELQQDGTLRCLTWDTDGILCDPMLDGKHQEPVPKPAPEEPFEPEEDDYTTTDHRTFYQYGKVAFVLEPDEPVNSGIARELERQQLWSNVWFISDHGNAHLIHYWKED